MIHKTTRSILSVLLAVLLLVTSTPLTPAFAGDGGAVSLQSESGEGRALEQADDGKYYISTAEQLKEFADKVNDDSGKYTDIDAELTADIDLNNQPWYPIGSDSRPYSGTFNGAGHTISGLYIDSNADYQGLFGYLSTDGDNTGTVQNLTVSGDINGGMYVGGVVGNNEASVENCYNTGKVSGSGNSVGGVVGNNHGSVENCYNTGEVSGSGNSVGGVVGNNHGSVENCYNTGEVSGNKYVGGVVGLNSGNVENCYNTGQVNGSGNYVGGVVGLDGGNVTGCYFLKGTAGSGIGNGSGDAADVKDLSDQDQFKGWDFIDTWRISKSLNRPVLQDNAQDGLPPGLGTEASPYEISTADQLENFRDIVNGASGNPAAWAELTDDIDLSEICSEEEGDSWTPIGTSSSKPYSGTFDGNGHTISGLYIKNTSSDSDYQGLFGYLGTSGDNKGTVQNLTVSGSVSGNNYVGGVVGYNDGGIVTGCTFSGSGSGTGVTGNNYVGGVVGENSGSNGVVENCHNAGSVKGSGNSVGGVVGENRGSGPVKNCYNTGKVTGSAASSNVGGVVGLNRGSVENCYNTVSVSGNSYVGGVVGDNRGSVTGCIFSGSGTVTGTGDYVGGVVGQNYFGGTVENCYNTGTVTGSGIYVGGVVGWNVNGRVENCYNTGSVSGSYFVGGVVGYNAVAPLGGSSVTNCYNTGSVSGNSVGGVVGYNNSGNVANCYYQQHNSAIFGIGRTIKDDISQTAAKSLKDFHSGEVAYLLQSKQTTPVWGQSNLTATTSLPTLVALNPDAAKEVYQLTFDWHYEGAPEGTTTTTNVYTNGSVTIPEINHDRTGYSISGWKDKNGKPVTAETTVEEDAVFTAEWTANTYTITVTAGSGGTVSGGGNVTHGDSVEVTATANQGYHFVNWTENGTEVSTSATYSFIATANRTLTANFAADAVEPDPTPTPTPDPTPSGPSTGDSSGWDDIRDELENAAKGDEITIDMGDETKVPAEIFESLAGKDVEISFDLGDIQWSVNGADIPTDTDFTDLDLGVNLDTHGIPVNVINTITGEVGTVQITLAHNGEFGFTMTLTAPLGVENSGYWANLYHYDEDADQLTFETAAEIDADGSVSLPMSHASQYAIVIDTHSHAAVDVSDLFSDIAPNAWYKDAVQYAYDNGLMTGVSATEFAPEATTTRAMIVSILARLENVTTAEAAGFADVDDNDWYATAVNWAANVGVVNGYEDNTFRPNTAITREQLAAILMNYAAYKGEDVSARADLTSYTDQPSTWATETMSWAVAEGLISGVTADTLQPQGAATRAQVAAILQRFLSE